MKLVEWLRSYFEFAAEEEFGVRREARHLKMHREILAKYYKWGESKTKAGKTKREIKEVT